MSKLTEGDKKRKAVFDKYSNNLEFLIAAGIQLDICPKFDKTYICPLCKEHFSVSALNQKSANPLTLEDTPPKALGGKATILTCRDCNNKCGRNLDVHLVNRMIELDQSSFIPKSEHNATFENDGIIVQGKIRIEADRKITVNHKEKINNPSTLKNYVERVLPNKIIKIIFRDKHVDVKRLQLALLKTGFLLTFSKYGYAFILQSHYDRIREQLLNPEKQIYPSNFWFHGPFSREIYGVPFLIEKGLEAVFPIFPLRTKYTERPFATLIPLSNQSIEVTITEVKKRYEISPQFDIKLAPMGPDINYLTNIEAINKMLGWIKNLQHQKSL